MGHKEFYTRHERARPLGKLRERFDQWMRMHVYVYLCVNRWP